MSFPFPFSFLFLSFPISFFYQSLRTAHFRGPMEAGKGFLLLRYLLPSAAAFSTIFQSPICEGPVFHLQVHN